MSNNSLDFFSEVLDCVINLLFVMKVLLRARAIETQCYVIAAAQTGKHNEIRQTFGHAMVSSLIVIICVI